MDPLTLLVVLACVLGLAIHFLINQLQEAKEAVVSANEIIQDLIEELAKYDQSKVMVFKNGQS
jgi:hypothetical protein